MKKLFLFILLSSLLFAELDNLLPQRITEVTVEGAEVSVPTPIQFGHGTPDQVITQVLESMANMGYPFSSATIDAITPISNGDFAMHITVNRGEHVKISGIYLNSAENIRTKVSTIEKEMLIRHGSPYSLTRTRKGIKRVNRMGVFQISNDNDMGHEIVRAESGEWYIAISGKDRARSSIGGAIGFSRVGDDTELGGRLEADVQNVWGGGRRIYFLWDALDQNRKLTRFSLRDPHMPGTFLGAEFSWQSTGREHYRESSIYTGIDWPLSFSLSISGGLDFGWVNPDSAGLWSLHIPKSQSYGLVASIDWNTMNAPTFPDMGQSVLVSTSASMKTNQAPVDAIPATSLEDAYSLRADLHAFLVRFIGIVGFSAELDADGILLTTEEVPPLSDMTYIGGFGSLRGHTTDFVSGERSFVLRSQLPLRLAPTSEIFAFFDIGGVHTDDLEAFTGYGLGILTETTIGTLSISYGLSKDRSITEGLLHFGIKSTF